MKAENSYHYTNLYIFLKKIKEFVYFLYDIKHKRPQICMKLTRFIDNDGRKVPHKILLAEVL